jgi:hypothetical protein
MPAAHRRAARRRRGGDPAPPSLGRPLRLQLGDGGAVVHDGDEPVAEARPATVALGVPGTASLAEARAAAGRYPLFQGQPFPTCFTCGPDRAPGDGLQIFPGPLPGGDLWAAPWTPDPSVADQDGLVLPEVVWAALDCPGGFAAGVGDIVMVLGRMAARLLRALVPARRTALWPGAGDRRRAASSRPLRRSWTSTAGCWRLRGPSG